MVRQTPTELVQNIARGRVAYRLARHRISRILLQDRDKPIDRLNEYLRRSLLTITKENWVPLAFDPSDWKTLSKLRSCNNSSISEDYLRLLTDYILTNKEMVKRVYALEGKISSAALDDDGPAITSIQDTFDEVDSQSLFAIRIVCARYSHDTEDVTAYLKGMLKTKWLRLKFLYPLINYAINQPRDGYIDSFLKYVLHGDELEAERLTIRFLLRDDICYDEPLSFKAYIALLCHPYDACEIIANHIELEFARKGELSPSLVSTLIEVRDAVNAPRLTALSDICLSPLPVTIRQPSASAIVTRYSLDPHIQKFLICFADTSKNVVVFPEVKSKVLQALEEVRKRPYPNVADYDYITAAGRQWRFTTAGSIINALLESLYLLPRASIYEETRAVNRLRMYYGAVCPFILTSPSGLLALTSQIGSSAADQAIALCANQINSSGSYSDRMWIKAVHWELREAEQNVQLQRWLADVRRSIRIAPSYLTGIRWAWVDEIIAKFRLRPFVGNVPGIYALLLMQIEEPARDPTVLRTAIEPLLQGLNLADSVKWLMETFSHEAVAFVRYLLTPEIILLLKLAPNETAALAGRVFALETCVRAYGFSDLLSETLFDQESKALTSALLLLNVSRGQFEIPWGIFRRDAADKQTDLFSSYFLLSKRFEDGGLLGNSILATPHRFRNGKIVDYKLRNRDWPLANLLLVLIEDFLQHPSFGLEVLLSTRFRHDTLRREILRAVGSVEETPILGIVPNAQRAIVKRLTNDISQKISAWLDRRMHSRRPDKPEGLFDLAPSQQELLSLITSIEGATKFEPVIEGVLQWLRSKLDGQLEVARQIFVSEFDELLRISISEQKDMCLASQLFRNQDVNRIVSALETALTRRISDLTDWFNGTAVEQRTSLSFSELKLAVDGVFENVGGGRQFVAKLQPDKTSKREVEPEKVRICFDLLSEIFSNAANYGAVPAVRLRIRPVIIDGTQNMLFSNAAPFCESVFKKSIEGEQFEPTTQSVFREGNSGFPKIAALSATLVGRSVEICAIRKARSFHLIVPIWRTLDVVQH